MTEQVMIITTPEAWVKWLDRAHIVRPVTIHQAKRARFVRQCRDLAGVIAYQDGYWFRRPRIAQKTVFVVTFERLLRGES